MLGENHKPGCLKFPFFHDHSTGLASIFNSPFAPGSCMMILDTDLQQIFVHFWLCGDHLAWKQVSLPDAR